MRTTLDDALAHHVWATLRVLDACMGLSPEQLETNVPGTYGSIMETLRHLVGSDASYLWVLTGGQRAEIDAERMDLAGLRAESERHAGAWSELLASDPDPEADVVRHRDDGSQSHASMGLRLAQVIHHGTDHRSQVATALTGLGIESPEIDVWAYAEEQGRISVTEPS